MIHNVEWFVQGEELTDIRTQIVDAFGDLGLYPHSTVYNSGLTVVDASTVVSVGATCNTSRLSMSRKVGDARPVTFRVVDGEGDGLNIAGQTFELRVRPYPQAAVSFTVSGVILDAAEGLVKFAFTSGNVGTASISSGVVEIWRTDADGVGLLVEGDWSVRSV